MKNPSLKERVAQLEAERDYWASFFVSFFEGRVPEEGATLQHHIIAQWGRKRLEHQRGQAALLRPPET